MTCKPFMCCRSPTCLDTLCPGHPSGVEACLDDVDRGALVHDRAMHARVGSFYPRDTASDEAQDRIKADEDSPESAIGMALRLGKTAAIVIAAVAAAWGLAVYFPAWPWLVDKLAF